MISIGIDQRTVATGGVLTANVRWSADGDRRARRIIVAAEWKTEGKGDKAVGVARSVTVTPSPDAREAIVPVRFLIPYEGPITFQGTLISLVWILRVRVDQFGLDEFAEKEFRVEPRVRK